MADYLQLSAYFLYIFFEKSAKKNNLHKVKKLSVTLSYGILVIMTCSFSTIGQLNPEMHA